MVSISGSKKLKRQMAPLFWGITRKDKRFVVTVKPGGHKKDHSIPTAVFVRDTIKLANTLREAKSVIYGGKIKVDGVTRKSLHHGIGLMDVVEMQGVPEIYRLVPKDLTVLKPIAINASEKTKKLLKVTKKVTIKGKKTQIGFHDGRNLISDAKVSVGDTCVVQVPETKILDIVKLEKGTQVIVTSGVNAGKMGRVAEMREGTFVLPKRALIDIDDRQIEVPSESIMAVGKDKPVIQIQ
ncbi:MAG TPA: 30S ribosomal protein S4e [Candidatus Nitrosotalea sp.]|nr:30S ribosomal protein S4e [Candidatus Nitrosotalea sp.]